MTTDPAKRHKAEAAERLAAGAEREAKAERRTERRRAERTKAIREWAILVLALAACAVVLLQQRHTSTVTACQARYNNAFAADLTARAALTDRDHKATTGLIEGVFAPPKGLTLVQRQAYYARLFAAYRQTEDQITEERRAHPFPQLPSKACR